MECLDCRSVFAPMDPSCTPLFVSKSLKVPSFVKAVNNDSKGEVLTATCPETNTSVVAKGCELILFSTNSESNEEQPIIELEFESVITALCWDRKGECLVIADVNKTLLFLDGLQGTLLFSYPLPLPVTTSLTNANLVSLVYLEPKKTGSSTTLSSSSSSSSLASSLLLGFDDNTILQIPKVPLSSISSVVKSSNGLKKIETALRALKVNLLYQRSAENENDLTGKVEKMLFLQSSDRITVGDDNNDEEHPRDVLFAFAIDTNCKYPFLIRIEQDDKTSSNGTSKSKVLMKSPCCDMTLLNDDNLMLVTEDNHLKVVNIAKAVEHENIVADAEIIDVKLPTSVATSTTTCRVLHEEVFQINFNTNNAGKNTTRDKENENPHPGSNGVNEKKDDTSIACFFSLFNSDVTGNEATKSSNISSFCLLNIGGEESRKSNLGNRPSICALVDKYVDPSAVLSASVLPQYSSLHRLNSSSCLYWGIGSDMNLRCTNNIVAQRLVAAFRDGMMPVPMATYTNDLKEGSPSPDALATIVSRIYFSRELDDTDIHDVLGHLAKPEHIVMVTKTMIALSSFRDQRVVPRAESILKELHHRYGDDRYLDGLQEVDRLQYSIETVTTLFASSQRFSLMTDRIFHSLICCENDVECRTAASQSWRECVERGFISEACLIVSRHMNSMLKAEDLRGLKLKQLSPSLSLVQVIQFVNESLKPTLLRLQRHCSIEDLDLVSEMSFFKNIVLGLCVDLCSRAAAAAAGTAAEGSSFDPNATLAAQIAVDVLNIVVDDEASATSPWTSQLKKAKALLHGLKLQRYLLVKCDTNMSLNEVMRLGLPGVISHRVFTLLSEDMLSEDIRERIQPLCVNFDFNLEEFFEGMLRSVVSTYVVVPTEVEVKAAIDEKGYDCDSSDDKNDKDYQITSLSRLVKFLDFIVKPSLKASATLLLIQMPATVDTLASCENGDKSNNDRNDETPSQLLLRIAENCIQSPFVDQHTVDVLKEVMRSHRLRMLAAKYRINSIDIRDHNHIRAAVGTIAAQCSVGGEHNPILDTVEFGTLNIDSASVFARALVHCATSPSTETNADTCANNPHITSLLQLIPQYRLVHVIEDACTTLFHTMHQRYCSSGFHIEDEDDKTELIASCRGCIQIINYFLDKHRGSAGEAYSVAALSWLNQDVLAMLKKLLIMQLDFDTFISPRVMMNRMLCKEVAKQICRDKVAEFVRENAKVEGMVYYPFTSESRRLCSLLGVSSIYMGHSFLSELLKSGESFHAINVARNLGTSNSTKSISEDSSPCTATSEDAELLLDASITLVKLISEHQLSAPVGVLSKNKSTDGNNFDSFSASKCMLGTLAASTPSTHLEKCVDLLICNDLIVSVQSRIQSASSSSSVTTNALYDTDDLKNFSLSHSTKYSKDGILMSSGSIQGPVLKLAYQEIQRRWKRGDARKQEQQQQQQQGEQERKQEIPTDIRELIEILQRNENHMLASRVMMTSWYSDNTIGKSLNSSLLSLGRKVLGYRDIDCSLAVACYSTLSPNTMVRELQAVVSAPSTQVDFSRLYTLSVVGEELARLIDRDDLLVMFQDFQTNAKWWDRLNKLGVKFHAPHFSAENPTKREKYIRSLVPELLARNGMNVEIAMEYCRQFHVETSYALECFITAVLLAPTTSPQDLEWARRVRLATTKVDEALVSKCFQRILQDIHPLDYERQRFVLSWLIDFLDEDEICVDSDPVNNGANEISRSFGNLSTVSEGLNLSTVSSVCSENPVFSPDAVVMMNNESLKEKYKRYLDIISFLSNINVPLLKEQQLSSSFSNNSYNGNNLIFGGSTDIDWNKIQNQPEMLTFPSQLDVYKNLSGVYLTRIPIWSLLKEPWSLLDPLMSTYPDIAAKLFSLCRPLYLDKDVFVVRQLMAKYTSMKAIPSTSSSKSLSPSESNARSMGKLDDSPYGVLCSSLDTIIEDQSKIDLLKWVYDKESKDGDGVVALNALEQAISIMSTSSQVSSNDAMKEETLTLIVRLNCLNVLHEFQASCDVVFPQDLLNKSNALLSTPIDLCSRVLDVCCQLAWASHLDAFKNTGKTVLCVYEMLGLDMSASIIMFAQKFGRVVQNLSTHALRIPAYGNSSMQEMLLNIRQSLFNKLLYSPCKDSTNADKESDWAIHNTRPIQCPTSGEMRRRNDIYRAFCLALLAHTCSPSDDNELKARDAYISQLGAFATGAKTSSRITARGRFRCAQAVFYLRSIHRIPLMASLRHYLFCLGEVKESRMICSDETLAIALGHSLSLAENDSSPPPSPSSRPDPSMLIRTWIRDEGHLSDVIELCRDLLLSAGYISISYASSPTYLQLWAELLRHMRQRGQVVALIHSLVIVREASIFQSLFTSHPRLSMYNQNGDDTTDCQYVFGFELLNALTGAARDVQEKTSLLLEYLKRHLSCEDTTKKQDDCEADSHTAAIENDYRVVLLNSKEKNKIASSSSTFGETAPEDSLLYMKRICTIWKHILILKSSKGDNKLLVDACSAMSKLVINWLRQAHAFKVLTSATTITTTDVAPLITLAAMAGEACEESAITCMAMPIVKSWISPGQTDVTLKSPYVKIRELADKYDSHEVAHVTAAASFMFECLFLLSNNGDANGKSDDNLKSFIWRVCLSAFVCSESSLTIAIIAMISTTNSLAILKHLLHMTSSNWWWGVDETNRLFSVFVLKCCGQVATLGELSFDFDSVFSSLSMDEKRSLLLLLEQEARALQDEDETSKVEESIYQKMKTCLANPF